MKRIIRIPIFIITAAVVSLLQSCSKDFLERNDPQSLPLGAETIKDLESLENASNGTYDRFQNLGYYNRAFVMIPELIGDNTFISINNINAFLAYDNLTVANDDGAALDAWVSMYQAIANANGIISAASSIDFENNKAAADHIVGEMYAVRALAHFDLLRFYAQPYNYTAGGIHPGVPIVIKPQTEVIAPARNTVNEVYEQIIEDLKTAISLMNGIKKDGRFTRAAAKALLAKVYLYKEDWPNAELYATDVIENENYELLTTDAYVPSWNEDFSSESLFEVDNTPLDRPGIHGITGFYHQAGYGDLLATEDLYNQYTETDVRRELIVKGSRLGGEDPAYLVYKYPRGGGMQDDNIRVLRLSEVFLIRAEARAEQPGKEDGALSDLNIIVQRADPDALPVTSLSGSELVDRILLERRKELAFEGNRLFDLNRKKKDVLHIESEKSTLIAYPDNRLILPIPRNERVANPNIDQNPGYN